MDRRTYLKSVFDDTLQHINGDNALHMAQQQSIANQKLILETDKLPIVYQASLDYSDVHITRNTTLQAAAIYKQKYPNKRVCILNFASATNPGGGVTRGSSAQEEGLCRCTNLYNCLNTREMWDGFYNPHRQKADPLHNDDIIFTPNVQVFKDDSYNLLPEPFSVDVITCAAPNLRSQPANDYNPGDGQAAIITPRKLYNLHVKRARRIFTVAALNEADILILGAFGCGAFQNDPYIVAKAYRDVFPSFWTQYHTVEYAIYCRPDDDTNYRAFREVFSGLKD